MDADEPDKKASIQEPTPEDEADKKKVKQADQRSGADSSDAPKDDPNARKPDPKDTERKMETFGTAGGAAAAVAIFQTILPG